MRYPYPIFSFRPATLYFLVFLMVILFLALSFFFLVKPGKSTESFEPQLALKKFLANQKNLQNQIRGVSFLGSVCSVPNGPWGYLYQIDKKNGSTMRVCVPPKTDHKSANTDTNTNDHHSHRHGSNDYDNPDSRNHGKHGGSHHDGENQGKGKGKEKEKEIQKWIDRIFSAPREFPGYHEWKWVAGKNISTKKCKDNYGKQYGLHATGKEKGICSRLYQLVEGGETVTPCINYSDEKKANKKMQEFCSYYYPGSHLSSVNFAPCPQPKQVFGKCSFFLKEKGIKNLA
jgi:hypothetical protein